MSRVELSFDNLYDNFELKVDGQRISNVKGLVLDCDGPDKLPILRIEVEVTEGVEIKGDMKVVLHGEAP